MSRHRRSINRKLVTYVYHRQRKGVSYFYYEHPLMRKSGEPPIGFKQDWQKANEFARDANAKLSSYHIEIDALVSKVQSTTQLNKSPRNGRASQKQAKRNATMLEVVQRFEQESDKFKEWKSVSGTWQDVKGHLRDLKELEGKEIFSDLDASMVGEIITDHRAGSGRRKMRQTMSGIFKWAVNKGYADRNVALDYTLPKGDKHTQRERPRMTWKGFTTLRDKAHEMSFHWLADAMELALLTAQGRAEVVSWTFKNNIVKEDGETYLTFERQKTSGKTGGSWQKIKVGEELQKVLHRCRERAMRMGSPFIVTVDRGGMSKFGRLVKTELKQHRCQCLPDYLSLKMRYISQQLKENIGGDVFHEIRSLSCRIYFKRHGFEFVQSLTNHTTAKQTELYLQGDDPVYQEGFADLQMAMISNLEIVN